MRKLLVPVGLLAFTSLAVFLTRSETGLAQAVCSSRLPVCFSAGTPARADEINANFARAVDHAVPIGGIILWSGAVANIPSGWQLCDGTNSTPDLRDRFVVGAGGGYSVNNTGGANTVTLTTGQMPSHNHAVNTNSAGNHSHLIQIDTGGGGNCGGASGVNGRQMHNSDSISGAACNQEASTRYTGSHTHGINQSNRGSGGAHENRPPYWALAYIQRME